MKHFFFAPLFLALLLLTQGSAHAAPLAYNPKPVGLWLMELRADAKKEGISDRTFDAALKDFMPIDRIVALDRKQPEGVKSFLQYMDSVVPAARVNEGRKLLAENRAMLQEVSKKYGVPAQVIVALWGIETSYGKVTGGFSVPHALATLAYEGRRADFFRKELLDALRIIEQGHVMAASMQGSWAGAMGQSQFMPSSFLQFAVDYNGDGRRDIWATRADVFASIAHYLSGSGWNAQTGWGGKITLPKGFDVKLADINHFRERAEWSTLGVTLPEGIGEAAVMFPGEPYEGAYYITRNYPVILKWNRSRYFATAVGTLADRIAHGG